MKTFNRLIIPDIIMTGLAIIVLTTALLYIRQTYIEHERFVYKIQQNQEYIRHMVSARDQKELNLMQYQITRDPQTLTAIGQLSIEVEQALRRINRDLLSPQENKLLNSYLEHRQELLQIEAELISVINSGDQDAANSLSQSWQYKQQAMTAIITDLRTLETIQIYQQLKQTDQGHRFIRSLLLGAIPLSIILTFIEIRYKKRVVEDLTNANTLI